MRLSTNDSGKKRATCFTSPHDNSLLWHVDVSARAFNLLINQRTPPAAQAFVPSLAVAGIPASCQVCMPTSLRAHCVGKLQRAVLATRTIQDARELPGSTMLLQPYHYRNLDVRRQPRRLPTARIWAVGEPSVCRQIHSFVSFKKKNIKRD